MSTYEFWPGSVCDHWGGKEPWPGGYTEEPQRGEPFEQSLNPGGLQVWLTMLLSMLGHNLKGDQSVVPQSSKALFLPPRLCRSLFLHTRSLTIFSYLPTTENVFVNSGLNMHKTCRKWKKKFIIAFLWTSELFQGHIVTWKFFVLQINEHHILANYNKQMLKKRCQVS